MSDSLSHPAAAMPHQPADRVLMTLKTRGPQSIAVTAPALDLKARLVRLVGVRCAYRVSVRP